MAGLRETLREVGREVSWLLDGGAPEFVLGARPRIGVGEIPVFIFHSIDPGTFECQLRFLRRNGYHTLGADEFHAYLTGEWAVPAKSVLLTIDDGRSSVWTYGFPLLMKYELRAVCFLIPGYVRDSNEAGPNLSDVWEGSVPEASLVGRDPDLMNWEQIRRIHRSGCIDFQSHTLYHHRVFSRPDLRGFFKAGASTAIYDLVLPMGDERKALEGRWDELWGIPLYPSHSLMSGSPRFLSDPELVARCNRYVLEHGGRDFFQSRSWLQELRQVVTDWLTRGRTEGRLQSAQELRAEILENLRTARRLIEERLPGKRVRHLCYPYGEGSDLAVELSRQAGYVSGFWTARAARQLNRPGADPYNCARLKCDYLLRLPGQGRRSLGAIIRDKFVRRLTSTPVY